MAGGCVEQENIDTSEGSGCNSGQQQLWGVVGWCSLSSDRSQVCVVNLEVRTQEIPWT